MKNTNLIERVLEARDFSLIVEGAWGEQRYLHVAIPDLRDAPRHVWGDWGPMYTVSLPHDRSVKVSLRTSSTGAVSREAVAEAHLEVHSPMLASARLQTPLVMKLPLRRQGLLLQICYGVDGKPATAKLSPLSSSAKQRPLYRSAASTGVHLASHNEAPPRSSGAYAALESAHHAYR